MQNEQNMKNQEPKLLMSIPQTDSFDANQEKYDSNYEKFDDCCAVCGKGLKNPKFQINTIWGGSMYPANDKTIYDDAWPMSVGNDCIKRIPKEYIITKGA